MPSTEPQIDFSKIDFPTDKLTIKELDRIYGGLYKERGPRLAFLGDTILDVTIGGVIAGERRLTRIAFDTVLGRKVENYEEERAGQIEALQIDYVDLGLAKGKHQASQLIRDIEAAATEQARSYLKGRAGR